MTLNQRPQAQGGGHRLLRTRMSKKASYRQHRDTFLVGTEDQRAGLVCCQAALARMRPHRPRGLGSQTRTVTDDESDTPKQRDASGQGMAAGTWTLKSSTVARDGEETLPSDGASANFDFRFERTHTCFHLGRAACSNSIPNTLVKIPHASVLIFISLIVLSPLCHYIIVSFGVALLPCLIITCFRVTAQEEMDMAQEEHKDKGRHAIPHIPHRARDLSPLGVVCLRLDVSGA